MDRRQFIGASAVGGGGLILASQVACNAPKLSLYEATVVAFLGEVAAIAPATAATVAKATKLVNDFDAAYKKGDFTSAGALFKDLVPLITQVATDAGATLSDKLKLALALAQAAIVGIATLLMDAGQSMSAAEKVLARTSSASAVSVIENLADSTRIDGIFWATRISQ